MPDNHLFEYAVIRIVPRVDREEFLNVGVVVYCAPLKFLQSIFTVDEERLRCFSPEVNTEEVREHLRAFAQISKAAPDAGPIGKLDVAARFRWLTATRSTVVQSSKVHPGLCHDPHVTLLKLHEQLVL